MSQLGIYWPVVAGALALMGGVAGFVVALLQIKQLKLSIEKLEKEVKESRETIYRPSPEELGKYGRTLEQAVQDLERSYGRYAEITKLVSQQAQMQMDVETTMAQQLGRSLSLFAEAEHRIHKLREELDHLARDLGRMSETQ
jgi:hypothetical protein